LGPAVVVESRITINQRVQFEYNRAVLLPESSAILDAVVTTLRDHPEIRRMRVEGHADDQGSAGHNMSLSRSRARARTSGAAPPQTCGDPAPPARLLDLGTGRSGFGVRDLALKRRRAFRR
jgi:hypothetical protein